MPRLAHLALAAALLVPVAASAKNMQVQPVPNAWLFPNGDAANTRFADVETAPAVRPAHTQGGLGTIAAGAGPVIGPDGTVYIGNTQGKLMAFKRDGTPAWSRQLDPGQSILSSPVVSSDGSIFVVSQSVGQDTNVDPPFVRPDSTLHKFYAGGGYAYNVPFPEHGLKTPLPSGHGGTNAAPNIWRFNGQEAVIVPALYPNRVAVAQELWIEAFAVDAPAVLDEELVTYFGQELTASGPDICGDRLLCIFPGMGFRGQGDAPPPEDPKYLIPKDARAPMAGVAIFQQYGNRPWIIVSDNAKTIKAYGFSPGGGFVEGGKGNNNDWHLQGSPMVMPDTTGFIGLTDNALVFHGVELGQTALTGGKPVGVPTRRADGSIVYNQFRGWSRLQNNVAGPNTILPGESMVPNAASRNFLYMSRADALYSFDTTMNVAAKYNWGGGGVSPVAIGPYGNVYAIAHNALYVFDGPCLGCPVGVGDEVPASSSEASGGTAPKTTPEMPNAGTDTASQSLPAEPNQPPSNTSGNSHFDNPLGPTGKRLYACTEVGGDTCGKKVANAYCQTNGWAKADKFDVDSKKTQAETMAGEICTKNKCKVFDYIDCEN